MECKKCGLPQKMYWCEKCESSEENEECPVCDRLTSLDKDYHKNCDRDETYCHLCGSVEEAGGWCTNTTCAEYTRYGDGE